MTVGPRRVDRPADAARPARPAGVVSGIGLAAAGYALFSVQDAVVKGLAVRFAVTEILFARSVTIVALALAIGGLGAARQVAASPNRLALVMRAGLILGAWQLYYAASRDLGLAQLTTLYFAAPIVAVALAVLILRERVDAARWGALAVGFAGVVLAARPGAGMAPLPTALALLAACLWGCSVILVRWIGRTDTSATQVLGSNTLFALATGVTMPWLWRTPDLASLGLMVGLGLVGGLGQVLLFEGFRHAPASVLAPIEYTGLVWAFVLGYAVWGDVPAPHVFVGAGLIACASLGLVWYERRRARGAPGRDGDGDR